MIGTNIRSAKEKKIEYKECESYRDFYYHRLSVGAFAHSFVYGQRKVKKTRPKKSETCNYSTDIGECICIHSQMFSIENCVLGHAIEQI